MSAVKTCALPSWAVPIKWRMPLRGSFTTKWWPDVGEASNPADWWALVIELRQRVMMARAKRSRAVGDVECDGNLPFRHTDRTPNEPIQRTDGHTWALPADGQPAGPRVLCTTTGCIGQGDWVSRSPWQE